MNLRTDALDPNGFFDPRYTCDFDNSSPELRWEDPPRETRAFVLFADDLDSSRGVLNHWVVFMIPAGIRHLPAGIPPQESLPNGIRQGVNGFGKLGYTGPCPPYAEGAHRYAFRLFALRENPDIPARTPRDAVLSAISPYIIASSEWIGRYQRASRKAG